MPFDPKQRRIFRYFDGSRQRGIDPLEIDIAMEAVDFDWEANFSLMRADDTKIRLDAMQSVVAAARKVFKIPEFDIADDGKDSGLGASEVLDLLGEFLEWKSNLRNFIEPLPTSPPSTEAAPVSTATASGTACTSTSPARLPGEASP